jgi:cytidine deaminase
MTDQKTFELSPDLRQRLIEAARAARQHAYAPYSQYPVGAALLTASGQIVTGCNVEIAVLSGGVCAERTAVFKAISEGERNFRAIAVVTGNGVTPCGVCRQVLTEFAPDLHVIAADTSGTVTWEGPLSDLLPVSFGPHSLAGGQEAGSS